MRKVAASAAPDVLSKLLGAARFRGTVPARTEFRAPWGLVVSGRDAMGFHYVVRGRCCAEVEGVEGRTWLNEGDVAILSLGRRHVFRDAPSSSFITFEELIQAGESRPGVYRAGGNGELTILACCAFSFEDTLTNPLFKALPPILTVRRGVSPWFKVLTASLKRELVAGRPGAETVATRLAEILFVEAVRTYFTSSEARQQKLGLALADPRIGEAVALIHRHPERRWTVDGLAKRVAMSRTAFATRFAGLVGETPLHYVGRCRIARSAALLRSSDATIVDVARRVGFSSDVAFTRAFKRYLGTTPASFRTNGTGQGSRR